MHEKTQMEKHQMLVVAKMPTSFVPLMRHRYNYSERRVGNYGAPLLLKVTANDPGNQRNNKNDSNDNDDSCHPREIALLLRVRKQQRLP